MERGVRGGARVGGVFYTLIRGVDTKGRTMSEQRLTRYWVDLHGNFLEMFPGIEAKPRLVYLASNVDAHLVTQREEIERLTYCVQVHSDVLGETIFKHEKQVAALQAELDETKLRRSETVAMCEQLQRELEGFRGIFGDYDEPPRTIEQARIMWDTLKAELEGVRWERDDLKNKLEVRHE